MSFNKKFFTTGGIVASTPSAPAGLDPLQNFETVTYTGSGSIRKITGYIRKGAAFNGSSSKINTNLIAEGTGGFAASFWIKTTSTADAVLITDNTNGGSPQYSFYLAINSGQFQVGTKTGVYSIGSTSTVTDGNWHNVVITYDTDGVRVYVDSSTVYFYSESSPKRDGNHPIWIGVNGTFNNQYFNGSIDQVRIFNTALNSTQVGQLAAEDYTDPKKSTTDYFGNGSGVALYELDDDANDTGGTYNGTPTNINFLGMAFQPDLVWIKRRDSGIGDTNHLLFDSVRGAGERLISNSTVAEDTATDEVTSFDSNGFTVGADASTNGSSGSMVAWCWKAADTTTTITANTIGNTIASDVRANTEAGFSIVKWTGDGTNATIGHGLSSTPEMIIVKPLDSQASGNDWKVYHSGLGNLKIIYLNLTVKPDSATSVFWGTINGDVFGQGGADVGYLNILNYDYIAYCFHSVEGYQKVGSYQGSGAAGKIVYTDSNGDGTGTGAFRPRFVMIKRTDVANSWVIIDSARDTSDPYSKILWADLPDAEADGGSTTAISFSDTGFSMSTSAIGSSINANNGTYIYLAIA